MTRHDRRGRAPAIGIVVVLASLGFLPSTGVGAVVQDGSTMLPDGVAGAGQAATPVGGCPRTEGRRVARAYGFALGDGPVHAVGFGPDGVANYDRSNQDGGWHYVKVLWIAEREYDGPVRVSGRQLDGANEVRFQDGADPAPDLQLPNGAAASRWREWATHVRLRAPGCYALQVEGTGLSEEVVFLAVDDRPEELAPLPQPGTSAPELPRRLLVGSAVELVPGWVRLALIGEKQLVVRVDVGPTGAATSEPLSGDARRLDTPTASVRWVADPEHGWPHLAAWDDGRHSFRLTVLDGDRDGWSEADLVQLVDAFAAAAPAADG